GKNLRSERRFWPERISTTSSVGTSTSPKRSCMPVRAMRSRSACATDFSKPEYACTTYQRLTPCVSIEPFTPSLTQQEADHPLDDHVERREDQADDDDRDDHHPGHAHGLLPRRPDHLAQLEAGLGQEAARLHALR